MYNVYVVSVSFLYIYMLCTAILEEKQGSTMYLSTLYFPVSGTTDLEQEQTYRVMESKTW